MDFPSIGAVWAFSTTMWLLLQGCGSPEPEPGKGTLECRDAPSWYQDVQPIVGEHCQSCHSEGGVAGSRPWTTYEETQPWASLIAATAVSRDMPPFIANDADDCAHRFPMLHDMRLDDADVETLARWSECGQLEGDASAPTPIAEPPSFSLDDWTIEIEPLTGFAPERGDVEVCFVAPVPAEAFAGGEDVLWVNAMEVVPEDLSAAHHVHVQIHRPGIEQSAGPEGWWVCSGAGVWGGIELGGWLPGSPPTELPEGSAFPLLPDDLIAFQVHYHVTDDLPHFDKTRIRLRTGAQPEYQPQMFRVGNASGAQQGLLPGDGDVGGVEFRIPAGVSDHTETTRVQVPGEPGDGEFSVFVVSNHMHQVGVSMKMWVEHDAATKAPEEPLEECLLSTPRYDFDWQGFFYYDVMSGQAPKIRTGDHVRIECTYDNTTANETWMEALEEQGLSPVPRDVWLGSTSLDEMCSSLIGALRVN